MPIRLIENFRALFYAPFYAAQATGAYRALGLDVEILPSASPTEAAAALRDGTADVMWGGPLRVLMTAERDPAAGFVCFCNCVERDPFFLIGRPDADFSLGRLPGLRFASVSEVPTPWLCLQDDLRRINIDPASLNHTTGLTMAESAQALRDGQLDVIQIFQPYAEMLIREGFAPLYAAASRGLTAYTTLVTTRSTIAARRPELTRMVRAMGDTLRWFDVTQPLKIAQILHPWFPDLAPELLAACITRYRDLNLWALRPILAQRGFHRLQTAMLTGGALRGEIPFETCVDNSLA